MVVEVEGREERGEPRAAAAAQVRRGEAVSQIDDWLVAWLPALHSAPSRSPGHQLHQTNITSSNHRALSSPSNHSHNHSNRMKIFYNGPVPKLVKNRTLMVREREANVLGMFKVPGPKGLPKLSNKWVTLFRHIPTQSFVFACIPLKLTGKA